MEKINEIIKAIEATTDCEDVEFIEFDGNAYYFVANNYDDEMIIEIKVTIDDEFVVIKKIRRRV